MKHIKLITAATLLLFATSGRPDATEEAPGPPPQTLGASYQGKAEWTGHRRSGHYVTMRDGVRIAVDVLLPEEYNGEGAKPGALPVIFEYTPYHRSSIDPESGEVPLNPLRAFFLSHGYAYVSADFRGTGASFGWMNHMSQPIQQDGGELVDWIAAQPWSDGNVGMWGGSYVGWSQMATASIKPQALKAIIPNVIGWDRYILRPGGVYSDAFAEIWSAMAFGLHRSQEAGLVWSERPAAPPVTPVTDEDGDGELLDEIPLDADGSGAFDDDYAWPVDASAPPQYSDGVARSEHLFFNAIMEHARHPGGAPGTYDLTAVVQSLEYWDSPRMGDGQTAASGNFSLLPAVSESGVAIYNVAGWWDAFPRSSLQIFATLRDTNPSRIAVWPKYHQGLSEAAAETLGVSTEDMMFREKDLYDQLRWYDRWLKGVDNGIDTEPPVQIYVFNGEGWRGEQEWPLAREQRTKMHLAENGALSAEPPPETGGDEYFSNFTHNSGWGPALVTDDVARINALRPKPEPVATVYSRNRHQMMGVPETAPFRTEQDEQALVFTSEPLDEDTEVTGHPIVSVWVSSTADYGDLFFYLEDVDARNNAILVTEHPHRAGFNTLVDDDLLLAGVSGATPGRKPGIDVKPDLPWHGYRESDYTDRVFAGGAVVNVTTDLLPVSWLFKKGHRIRLSIATADWPTFQLHPKLAPTNDPAALDTVTPTITVHRGPRYPSSIDLPVIPR